MRILVIFIESLFMIKLFRLFAIKLGLLILIVTWRAALSANEAAAEVAINIALETAQIHTPGKVVAHEKADELLGTADAGKGAKTLQPVYRIKILSQQGVMKILLVHRLTGQVIE